MPCHVCKLINVINIVVWRFPAPANLFIWLFFSMLFLCSLQHYEKLIEIDVFNGPVQMHEWFIDRLQLKWLIESSLHNNSKHGIGCNRGKQVQVKSSNIKCSTGTCSPIYYLYDSMTMNISNLQVKLNIKIALYIFFARIGIEIEQQWRNDKLHIKHSEYNKKSLPPKIQYI